ncbi:MAG TPA: TIGR04211 family SH3 domain-containing protein [Thiomicrorhabdus sp.]|nr:TIGR04211 family SH3 domain-containing protein [Thiomicrorhabdus sp.]
MKKFNKFNLVLAPVTKGLMVATIIGSLSFTSHSVHAAVTPGYTNYVTDTFKVPLRRGGGTNFKISRMMPPGAPVKILEVNGEGWALVEYKKSGKTHTGWMHASTLQNMPVARVRLEKQIKKTTALEEKLNGLQHELKTLKERHEETNQELATVKQEKFELTQALTRLKSISSNAVELDEQNQQMKQRLSTLEDQNAIMREQIDQSEDAIKRQWFLTGGGVLLFGLLLGRFFRIPAKRKKWGEI